MKLAFFIIGCAIWLAPAIGQHSHSSTSDPQAENKHAIGEKENGKPGSVTGYVRDVACLLRVPSSGAATTPNAKDCLEQCVRGGSPLGVLTEEGELYTPISNTLPDTAARSRLLPYVGKYVKASGRVFERGGMHAIAIEKVQVIDRPPDSRIPAM